MNVLIIYASKSGFTKQYATWLSGELHAPMVDYRNTSPVQVNKADVIVFGGSLHAVGIYGFKNVKKSLKDTTGKKIIVFATGVSPASDKVVKDIRAASFSLIEHADVSFYYLRGGFDYKGLPILDKILMRVLKWKILMKKKETLSSDEIGMLAIFDKRIDYTNKSSLRPILDEINQIKK